MTTAVATDPIRVVLDALGESVRPAGAGWSARCPAHSDRHASLSISIGDNGAALMRCHAGCSIEAITAAMGLAVKDLFPPRQNHNGNGAARKIVAIYDYVGPNGDIVHQTVRYNPRGFSQRRPDGRGGHIWKMDGVLRVLYRLIELRESSPDEWVYICEGEKDCDRLASVGLIATCNVGGAGKWMPEYNENLRDRRACIIADRDKPGRDHAQKVARSLHGIARDVRVIELPGDGVKDASDWFDAGGMAESLVAIAEAAPTWKPESVNSNDDITTAMSSSNVDHRTHPYGSDDTQAGALTVANDTLASIARNLTDVGNAARFVLMFGSMLRYCYAREMWVMFTGKRWEWDRLGRAVALAKQMMLAILDEAQTESRLAAEAQSKGDEQAAAKHADRASALVKWGIASQRKERITAAVSLAQPDLAISPDDLDANPLLLNLQNGTFEIETAILRPHRREDFITKICRGSYRPDAPRKELNKFLARIFRTHPTLIGFIQRAFGYGATGLTIEQVVFFLFGRGANGKTTLIDAVMYVLGDFAGKADPDLLMMRDGSPGHPCNVADLMGKRSVVVSETNDGKRFDESKLKDLVGETRLKAREMYGSFFEFTATTKFFMYSNHKPVVRGTDFGFWRRMRLIPFVETIGDEEKDADLPGKLKSEVDGILTWIVDGAVLWRSEGLGVPVEVSAATADYRQEMDSIGAFIDDFCLDGEKLVSYAKDLYAAYTKWCDENGEHRLTQKRLGTTLTERGYRSERCSHSGLKKWLGIGLKAGEMGE
jgi:putative DNA primase/helicase